jgi:cytochrome c-type biogenesis protein CcmH/NrfG
VENAALFLVVLALGGLAGQRPKRARLLAEQLAAQDQPVTPDLRALLDDPLSRALNHLSAAIVIAIIALMVFK